MKKVAETEAQTFKKTVEFTFDHNAETISAALGISDGRSAEISDELQEIFTNDESGADQAQKVFSTYEGNEFVWALINLEAAQLGSVLSKEDESVAAGDDNMED